MWKKRKKKKKEYNQRWKEKTINGITERAHCVRTNKMEIPLETNKW